MPNKGKRKGRVADRVLRRVVSVGWSGGKQVRLDVGGLPQNPKFCVFVPADHELASLDAGDRLPGTFVYEVIRRVEAPRRDGKPELRFDLGGTLTKPSAHIYTAKKNSQFADFVEGDHISL